jgi:hypothetical protein
LAALWASSKEQQIDGNSLGTLLIVGIELGTAQGDCEGCPVLQWLYLSATPSEPNLLE